MKNIFTFVLAAYQLDVRVMQRNPQDDLYGPSQNQKVGHIDHLIRKRNEFVICSSLCTRA